MNVRFALFAITLVAFVGIGNLVSAEEPPAVQAETEHFEGAHAEHDDAHGDSHGEHHGDSHGAHGDDHAAHGDGHQEGNTNPLSVDPDLMIFTGVIFLLLLAVLSKFAWGPIRDSLDERENGIRSQLEEAQRNNDEARRLLAEHEAKLATTSEEVKSILDNARKEGEAAKTSLLAEAEKAAKAEKDRAVREITAAKHTALQDLAQASVDQAVGLAGQIVKQKLNADDHAQLIQDALAQYPSEN